MVLRERSCQKSSYGIYVMADVKSFVQATDMDTDDRAMPLVPRTYLYQLTKYEGSHMHKCLIPSKSVEYKMGIFVVIASKVSTMLPAAVYKY